MCSRKPVVYPDWESCMSLPRSWESKYTPRRPFFITVIMAEGFTTLDKAVILWNTKLDNTLCCYEACSGMGLPKGDELFGECQSNKWPQTVRNCSSYTFTDTISKSNRLQPLHINVTVVWLREYLVSVTSPPQYSTMVRITPNVRKHWDRRR